MARPTKARSVQIAARRTRAIRMRVDGATWQEIADELGYSTPSAACQDLGRALAEQRKEQAAAADELREVELAKLDALEQQVWTVLLREHVTVSHGRVIVIKGPDEQEHSLRDDGPTLAAVDRLVKISESRRRLQGLDSPVKVDAGVTVRFSVDGVDPETLR